MRKQLEGIYPLTVTLTSSYSASYNYDNAGNITSKTINGVTYNYGYNNSNWKDLLTSYRGQTITYDAIGNPLFYRDNMTMSWTGRQLSSLFTDTAEIGYLYNSDGIRTQKTVDGVTTQYFLDGSRILAEKTDSSVIWYIYDDAGDILGLIYNGAPYYYLKNMQGDVISIVDSNLNVVNGYTYDAWGKVTAITGSGTIGAINLIRYRGYYYDNETGFYYLNSRYYDPETGRFINADDTSFLGASGTVLGYNLFAYCENNPVNNIDIGGYVKINVKWMGLVIDIIIRFITVMYAIAKTWSTIYRSASKLVSFGNKLISVAQQIFKKLDNRLYCFFAKESTYRIIKSIGLLASMASVLYSIGSVVQYIIDILDGKWDGYFDTTKFGPKLDLTKDY